MGQQVPRRQAHPLSYVGFEWVCLHPVNTAVSAHTFGLIGHCYNGVNASPFTQIGPCCGFWCPFLENCTETFIGNTVQLRVIRSYEPLQEAYICTRSAPGTLQFVYTFGALKHAE